MTFDRYDIDPAGVVGVMWRREDGSLHRNLFAPGDDISTLPDDLQAVAANAWTPDVLAAWQASIVPPPPPAEPDPRDLKIADLEAAISALKKTGVLTDAMIDAEREASVESGGKI